MRLRFFALIEQLRAGMGNLARRRQFVLSTNFRKPITDKCGQGEGCETFIGNGVVKTGVMAEEDILLARPVLGQRSKRVVMDINTLFDLTTPFCSKSVELAPDPLSIQLKL